MFLTVCLLHVVLGIDALSNIQEQQTGRPVQAGGPGAAGSYSHPDGLDQGGTGCCGTCVVA